MFKDTEKELARLQEALLEEEEPQQEELEESEETEEFQNFANGYGAGEEAPEAESPYRGRGTTVRLTVLAIVLLLGILGIAAYWAFLFAGLIR